MSLTLFWSVSIAAGAQPVRSDASAGEGSPFLELALIGVGDSLTHGTMDGTNNSTNTLNAYLQKVAESLSQRAWIHFRQPLFDDRQRRIFAFSTPTNLGVDGADIFSAEGLEYYKRAGVEQSFVTGDYLADRVLLAPQADKYDKVMYPINLWSWAPVSQTDAAVWLVSEALPRAGVDNAAVIFWLGNNDSSSAAQGRGGNNPQFLPFPLDVIEQELSPLLRFLFRFGEQTGALSFDAYTREAIERNLTDPLDFEDQLDHVLARIGSAAGFETETTVFVLTLPYYSAVGYLFDSDDLEYYLRKLDPSYAVPPSFERVAPPGAPITDPLKGYRVSVFTFGFMYALLSSGYSVDWVNRALERDGRQRDGVVLTQAEQELIIARIDEFNASIEAVAAAHGHRVIDIGSFLNDALSGNERVVIDGRTLSRKWIRGAAFSLDGVHPNYTANGLIANEILEDLNAFYGIDAPAHDLGALIAADPYVDQDGDGFAPGPSYQPSGVTELLFLFNDPDDRDASVGVEFPDDVWQRISDVLLGVVLGIDSVRSEADRLDAAYP